jgi:hypothetical protein
LKFALRLKGIAIDEISIKERTIECDSKSLNSVFRPYPQLL